MSLIPNHTDDTIVTASSNQLTHALACLAPSSGLSKLHGGILSEHLLSQPIDELSLLELAHTMNPALGLTEEIIERSTNEFLERSNLKRSIISAPTPVSALEESYQEAWDGAETNAFVQACYQLAASGRNIATNWSSC